MGYYKLNLLTNRQTEDYEERAGIMEYHGNVSQDEVDGIALVDVLDNDPFILDNQLILL